MRVLLNNSILLFVYNTVLLYPVYLNISYWWNYGVLAGLCLVIQIVTGIFLAMHYVPFADDAFYSVEHIMRDVNYGWLLRYTHANGASFFFLVVYIHIFRNLYYQSYLHPRELLWLIGVAILLLIIITAFVGYVLPWGQMSFWAATVITSLFSAIPVIGNDLLIGLWGGYSVSPVTLNRFFSFHFFLPFVILLLVVLHIIVLHDRGSSNPTGLFSSKDKVPFSPYFIIKDFFGFYIFLFFFFIFVFFYPNYLGHPDNYILANSLVTPAHIVPEWYFLFFYAILRSIPNKLHGIIILASAILVFAGLPYIINYYLKCNMFRNWNKVVYWFFVVFAILLGWLGGTPIEFPFFQLSQWLTIVFFIYFCLVVNILMQYDMRYLVHNSVAVPNPVVVAVRKPLITTMPIFAFVKSFLKKSFNKGEKWFKNFASTQVRPIARIYYPENPIEEQRIHEFGIATRRLSRLVFGLSLVLTIKLILLEIKYVFRSLWVEIKQAFLFLLKKYWK